MVGYLDSGPEWNGTEPHAIHAIMPSDRMRRPFGFSLACATFLHLLVGTNLPFMGAIAILTQNGRLVPTVRYDTIAYHRIITTDQLTINTCVPR